MDSFEAHIPRLRRYARALTGDMHAADDLVQDTLERGWVKLSLWRKGSRLDQWLLAIMHNLFVNQYRSARPATQPLDDHTPVPPLRATQHDILELRDLDSVLARLPPEQREVLLLVSVEECSYADVARMLGIPQGTVMSRLSRARERLRALLEAGDEATRMRRVK